MFKKLIALTDSFLDMQTDIANRNEELKKLTY